MRSVFVGIVCIAALILSTGTAGASEEGGTFGDRRSTSGSPRNIEVETQVPGDTSQPRPVSLSDNPWADCTWARVTTVDLFGELNEDLADGGDWSAIDAYSEGLRYYGDFGVVEAAAEWHDVRCPAALFEPGGRAVWPVTERTPQVVIDGLAQIARSRASVPVGRIGSAPEGSVETPAIVHIANYLWVDNSTWAPVTASASIPGVATVTVTASPVSTTWSPGDGTTFTCLGPGTPFQPGMTAEPNCGHAYAHPSPGLDASDAYTLAVTTNWVVSYSCTVPVGGTCGTNVPMAGFGITATRPVWVGELQALNTV